MAKKKVIAYFMHEDEEAAAWQAMENVEETESYLYGEMEEAEVASLEEKGLIVQVLQDDVPLEAAEGEEAGDEAGGLAPAGRGVDLEPDRVDQESEQYYLIELNGPLLGKWRSEIEALDVRLLESIPMNRYKARLEASQVHALNELPFVRSVRLYGLADAAETSASRSAAPPPARAGTPRAKAMITFDVRLHQPEGKEAVLQWLQENAVDVAGTTERKIRLYLLEDSPLINELMSLPEVASLEEYQPPVLHNNEARVLLGIDARESEEITPVISQTGRGQVVGVADTGLDDQHPDFQGRVVGVIPLGRPNDASDQHGHGTHVSGSVLGDGAASDGEIRGAAPDAQLFFQSLFDETGGLGGLPLDLKDLFEEAYQAGVRIHNNSWGAATRSQYTFNSIEVDEFIANRRDMLLVISAGNEGQAADRLHSDPGFVDWLSIGSPASAKNALTVGAARSQRTSGGIASLTYGMAWPAQFPDPPISQEPVSGNPESLAAFSSRGPCDDRRIKPDLVAPGTDIVSAKSGQAPLRNFWGPYPGNAQYAFMGGTSMAAPLVAGCAALVREYFVEERNHSPSAALLKAALINSTRWLSGADATAGHPDLPNFHQGFGSLYMPWAIPNESEAQFRLEFVDTWEDPAGHFNRTGQRFRYNFSLAGGERLRLCLAWTDLPGRGLQNNLNIFLEHSNSGQKWVGNENLPQELTRLDPDNNVEVIRLENPPAGDYRLQVTASNLLGAGQDFAVVVAGDLSTGMTEI